MGVEIRRNFGDLTDLRLMTRADWQRVGLLARERIIRRTVEGRDEEDQAFRPYSDGYAAIKARMGASGRVDLQLSGEMLRAITVDPDDEGVTLSFNA